MRRKGALMKTMVGTQPLGCLQCCSVYCSTPTYTQPTPLLYSLDASTDMFHTSQEDRCIKPEARAQTCAESAEEDDSADEDYGAVRKKARSARQPAGAPRLQQPAAQLPQVLLAPL